MGTISRVTTWSTGDTLTASDLNGEFDNILSTANGSLNADNLGVTAGQASASKAIVLDSNKDFANATGSNQIRNLTLSGSLKIGTTFLPDAAGGADLGSTSLEWGDVYVADDKYLYMGSDQNIKIGYDETTTDSLAISAIEGAGLAITLRADEGDDAGDEWKLNVADGGTITLGNDIASAGTFVTHLTLTPHATVSSSTLALAGALTVAGTATITGVATVGGLTIGSAVINEAELETIDGITAGTVAASKAVVVDSNKDIGTFRNITLDGTLSDGNYTFDTSGNVSGLGTVGCGAVTSTGVVTGTGFTIGSAVINEAELETIDGVTAGTVTASKAVVVDSNKDIGTFRNITIDGTLSDGNYTFDTSGNVSGLGTIGSGAITATDTTAPLILKYDAGEYVTHAVSSAGVYSITTTDADSDSGAVTIDTVDSITLDSDTAGEGVVYADGGTNLLRISNSSSDVVIKPLVDAKDIVFQQYDETEVLKIDDDGSVKIGGGYGSTGVTVSGAGVLQANGAITSDGAVTGATLAGTISTAAQNSITSASSLATVGTITSGTWSGVIDGSATMTLGSDATGDIYYRDASGFLERLGVGSDGQVLTSTGTLPNWESAAGGGDFSGPGSATDNAIIRFDGTGGKTGQNSGVTIDDSNNVTGFGTLATSGAATLASLVCTAGATFGGGTGSTGATITTAGVGTFDGALTGLTVEATGDTSAADNAAIGYTSAEGLILTGQGSTSDVTIKNDADATVMSIPTGTTKVEVSSTVQNAAEIWSTNANPYLVVSAETETQNDTAGIAFNATKGQAVGAANTMAHIYAKVTNSPGQPLYGNLHFNTNSAETDSTKMIITSAGNVFFNDTANANITQGLTLNQAANDNEILAFKSSDIAHGMTDVADTNTYAFFKKAHGVNGGLFIQSLNDYSYNGLHLKSICVTPNQSSATSAAASIQTRSEIKSGTGVAVSANADNIFLIGNGSTCRVLFKGDGTVYASDTSWATALDDIPDALAGRAYTTEMAHRQGDGLLAGMEINASDLVQRMEDAGIVTHAELEGEGTIPGHRFLNLQKGIKFSWDMGFQNFSFLAEIAKVLSDEQRAALPLQMQEAFALLDDNRMEIN